MKRVLTAVVLIPLVLLVVFKAPLWLFATVAGLFAIAASYEYLGLARRMEATVPTITTLVIVGALVLTRCLSLGLSLGFEANVILSSLPLFLGLLMPLAILAWQMPLTDTRSSTIGAALAALVFPYIIVPFSSLLWLRMASWFFLIWLFFTVWAGDIFAYYIGKNFGKILLAPRVSPKKTWEGTLASVVGSVVISVILCAKVVSLEQWLVHNKVVVVATLPPIPIWVAILFAVLVNLAAQLGDLVESMIKRAAGVKDSGSLLPGHGGILDRVDALLFSAPVAVLLFSLFSLFTRPQQ